MTNLSLVWFCSSTCSSRADWPSRAAEPKRVDDPNRRAEPTEDWPSQRADGRQKSSSRAEDCPSRDDDLGGGRCIGKGDRCRVWMIHRDDTSIALAGRSMGRQRQGPHRAAGSLLAPYRIRRQRRALWWISAGPDDGIRPRKWRCSSDV